MVNFLVRRALFMILVLFAVSIISYVVMELPPGDFATTFVQSITESGGVVDKDMVDRIRATYGLDKPLITRYFKWITGFARGNLGYSFFWKAPVADIIASRFAASMILSLSATFLAWIIAFPISLYSATHQYSFFDYVFTLIGFIGLAIPNFLLALILLFLGNKYLGISIGGFLSIEYMGAPMSWGKMVDLAGHVLVPIIVIGTAGTAGLIRIIRANLIDEINKPYVVMARAKGLGELRLLLKYPVRIALNPFISSIAWILPAMIAGEAITSIVLGLPTAGPLFIDALMNQDMQLAGAYVMLISIFTIVGVFVSDILLAILDPRIKYT